MDIEFIYASPENLLMIRLWLHVINTFEFGVQDNEIEFLASVLVLALREGRTNQRTSAESTYYPFKLLMIPAGFYCKPNKRKSKQRATSREIIEFACRVSSSNCKIKLVLFD